MNTITFRLKSELKFQTLEIGSTFVSIGELKRLICNKLGLDSNKETVDVWDNGPTRVRYGDDNKLISKGQKLLVARVPVSRSTAANANETSQAQRPPSSEPAKADAPAEAAPAADEFGGDVYDEQEQLRMQNMIDEQTQEWSKQLAAGRKNARRRAAEEAALHSAPTGPPQDGLPGEDQQYRKKFVAHARGIPSTFLTRTAQPSSNDGDEKPRTIKLMDGTVATLATGDLQKEEEEAELAKQKELEQAKAKPTLEPLPALAFEDFSIVDPMALVQAQLQPTTSTAAATPPLQLEGPSDPTPPASPAPTALALTSSATINPPSPQPPAQPLANGALLPAAAAPSQPPLDVSLLNTCKHFLPYTEKLEDLLKVFGIPEPLTREEWEAFRAENPSTSAYSPDRRLRRRSPSPSRRFHRGRDDRDAARPRGDLRRGYRAGDDGHGPDRRGQRHVGDFARERGGGRDRFRARSRSYERDEGSARERSVPAESAGLDRRPRDDYRNGRSQYSGAGGIRGGRARSSSQEPQRWHDSAHRAASRGPDGDSRSASDDGAPATARGGLDQSQRSRDSADRSDRRSSDHERPAPTSNHDRGRRPVASPSPSRSGSPAHSEPRVHESSPSPSPPPRVVRPRSASASARPGPRMQEYSPSPSLPPCAVRPRSTSASARPGPRMQEYSPSPSPPPRAVRPRSTSASARPEPRVQESSPSPSPPPRDVRPRSVSASRSRSASPAQKEKDKSRREHKEKRSKRKRPKDKAKKDKKERKEKRRKRERESDHDAEAKPPIQDSGAPQYGDGDASPQEAASPEVPEREREPARRKRPRGNMFMQAIGALQAN